MQERKRIPGLAIALDLSQFGATGKAVDGGEPRPGPRRPSDPSRPRPDSRTRTRSWPPRGILRFTDNVSGPVASPAAPVPASWRAAASIPATTAWCAGLSTRSPPAPPVRPGSPPARTARPVHRRPGPDSRPRTMAGGGRGADGPAAPPSRLPHSSRLLRWHRFQRLGVRAAEFAGRPERRWKR